MPSVAGGAAPSAPAPGTLKPDAVTSTGPHKWWKDAIVYQVWPASFQDSNGDGIGDIPGIISRLDHIKSLGATALWLSPMYASPQVDMGYDISDYRAIYPPYGTMADMEALIKGCHDRGMKILCDLVVNHTSDEHAWFKESRSSKDNPKRHWYIWRPAKYDAQGNRQPPNNWRSCFNESVWQWDEHTQEYYLHLFVVGQPDLNWTNPECRKAILEDAVEFWLRDKGIDGFRIDTASLYSKPMDFPDAPVTEPAAPHQPAWNLFSDGPLLQEHLRDLGKVFTKYDAMTVGEFPNAPLSRSREVTSASDPMMSMVFDFTLCDLDREQGGYGLRNWKLSEFKRSLEAHQTHTEGSDSWLCHFLENHDLARSVSRFGVTDTRENTEASARMLALLNATVTGTLFIYQGQEISMHNVPRSWPLSEYLDVGSINYVKLQKQMGVAEGSAEMERTHDELAALARDHARTPVQWSPAAHSGFSKSKPWMRVNDGYEQVNVELQEKDASSVLNFYRRALRLRSENIGVLGHGIFRLHDAANDDTMLYTKVAADGRAAFVALNFTAKEQSYDVPEVLRNHALTCVLGTHGKPHRDGALRPLEGRLYMVA